MPSQSEESKEARRSSLALAFSAGWELVAFVVLGFFLGYWLDGRFGSSPWGVLVSTLTSIGYGLYRFIRTFSRPADGGKSGG